MSFPTTPILDNFNRANAANLGASWSPFAQSGNDAGITANQAYDANGAWNFLYWDSTTFGPDCESYGTLATIPTTNSTEHLWWIRVKDVTPDAWQYDGYVLSWYRDAGGAHALRLKRNDDAAATQLGATVSISPANGDKYGLKCTGSKLQIFVKDGAADWGPVATRTDATYGVAGYIGFGFSNEANWRMDDFGGGTYTTPAGFMTLQRGYWGP